MRLPNRRFHRALGRRADKRSIDDDLALAVVRVARVRGRWRIRRRVAGEVGRGGGWHGGGRGFSGERVCRLEESAMTAAASNTPRAAHRRLRAMLAKVTLCPRVRSAIWPAHWVPGFAGPTWSLSGGAQMLPRTVRAVQYAGPTRNPPAVHPSAAAVTGCGAPRHRGPGTTVRDRAPGAMPPGTVPDSRGPGPRGPGPPGGSGWIPQVRVPRGLTCGGPCGWPGSGSARWRAGRRVR